ncbi:hypothetical protein GXP67_15590 [Rhodocytophaga rosea]|uniref:Uncharacterized protein n=1 Tax=Rhodocytophaga rosea TaxID=2704465 RepID=A0A6C0GIS8_9BACT|nr:hypothetical protein [Rhodocytophaga rosea]QHT67961.1 hypothetical protein GXP67_15590 [Rhodocytophaga rosea]
MKYYQRHLSPDTNTGKLAQPEEDNNSKETTTEEVFSTDPANAAKVKAAPKDTNEMINNTGLDNAPANNDEDTDLSEGTHDADAATG